MTHEQFWSKVNRNGPYSERLKSCCWIWKSAPEFSTWSNHNYGVVRWNGRNQHAHRVAWEITYGVEVPRVLSACHACDNPPCVNPAHVWIGTKQHNAIDRVLKGRMGRVLDHLGYDGQMDIAPRNAA